MRQRRWQNDVASLRHVELKWLWVLDMVTEGKMQLKTVKRSEHVAYHLAKPNTNEETDAVRRSVGAEFRD